MSSPGPYPAHPGGTPAAAAGNAGRGAGAAARLRHAAAGYACASAAEDETPMLRTTISGIGDRVVVAVDGDVDSSTAHELTAAIHDAREFAGPEDVVVLDLAAVTFLDSAGLAVLLVGHKLLPGRFAVARPSRAVRAVFDIVRLGDVVTVLPDAPRAETADGDAGGPAAGPRDDFGWTQMPGGPSTG